MEAEEWQCGQPYCQHPGCWLASRDKSVEIPPINRSIIDAIEKTKKSTHVMTTSPVESLSLPTLKLIEVDSEIPSVNQPKVLPRLPTSRPTTRTITAITEDDSEEAKVTHVQMVLTQPSHISLTDCTFSPVYIWKPGLHSRISRAPVSKEEPELKTVDLSEHLPPKRTPRSASKTCQPRLRKKDILNDENVTKLSEDMIQYLLLSEISLDSNGSCSGGVHRRSRHAAKKPIKTIKLEIQAGSPAVSDNTSLVQNEDNNSISLNIRTPPTTPVSQNKVTAKRSPHPMHMVVPNDGLFVGGSGRPQPNLLSPRVLDSSRYPYGNPNPARIPRSISPDLLYSSLDEPSTSKPSLNADTFLQISQYTSRDRTPVSSISTSSSYKHTTAIRVPYSPYSEDALSTPSTAQAQFRRYHRTSSEHSVRGTMRAPPPTSNTSTISPVKGNLLIGPVVIPELPAT